MKYQLYQLYQLFIGVCEPFYGWLSDCGHPKVQGDCPEQNVPDHQLYQLFIGVLKGLHQFVPVYVSHGKRRLGEVKKLWGWLYGFIGDFESH